MCKNLEIYNAVRKVPQEAQKPIMGGRLKGKTDINPMWRIKTLTEQFGVVGFGWYTETLSQWTEKSDNGEVAAFCNINLYIRQGDEWSKPIFGTGGAMLVEIEKSGAHTEDEAFKKAYTDAISVACKAIGIGADVYWASDRTKYQTSEPSTPSKPTAQQQAAQPKPTPKPQVPAENPDLIVALQEVKEAQSVADLSDVKKRWRDSLGQNKEFVDALTKKYNAIINK